MPNGKEVWSWGWLVVLAHFLRVIYEEEGN